MQDELDTSAARREILSRIRTLQGRPEGYKAGELKNAIRYMQSRERGPQPKPVDDVVALFVEKSKAMLTTIDTVGSSQDVVQAVDAYLLSNQLKGPISVWPSLSNIPWKDLCEPVRFGRAQGDDMVGISGVAYALAETGTIVFASKSDEPSSTHLLPETHIAIVKTSQIFHTMEDVFSRLREDGRAMPRALNFVSGPSRTADIEQTIVLGAHGPYRVHIILVAGD